MKITYDYSEFLSEIRAEVEFGLLTLAEEVLILRGEPLPDGYRPVIDWYYSEERMLNLLITERDEMSDEERQQFSDDYPSLEPIKVKDFINEMREKSTLFS